MKILFVLTTGLLSLVWAMPVRGEVDDTLVLCLSFDEGTGDVAHDSSPHGFDAKVSGATWVEGKFGKALRFDGADDFVSVGDAPELRLLNGGTIMAWIYLEGQGASVWPRIICKELQTGSNGGYHMPIDWNRGRLLRFVIDGGGGTSVGDPLEFKTWYHVAVAFDGEKVRFYTNGEKIEEVPQEKPTPDTQAEMQIGNSPVGVRPFQGIIDEVRIWSRALSDDEILEQMKIGTKQLIPVNPRAKLSTTWAEIKDIPVKPSRQAP